MGGISSLQATLVQSDGMSPEPNFDGNSPTPATPGNGTNTKNILIGEQGDIIARYRIPVENTNVDY